MMNRKEFQQYLQETIKDYLPESYADAKITFNEVIKNNDTHLTGISIAKPGEKVLSTSEMGAIVCANIKG